MSVVSYRIPLSLRTPIQALAQTLDSAVRCGFRSVDSCMCPVYQLAYSHIARKHPEVYPEGYSLDNRSIFVTLRSEAVERLETAGLFGAEGASDLAVCVKSYVAPKSKIWFEYTKDRDSDFEYDYSGFEINGFLIKMSSKLFLRRSQTLMIYLLVELNPAL